MKTANFMFLNFDRFISSHQPKCVGRTLQKQEMVWYDPAILTLINIDSKNNNELYRYN